MANAKLFSIFTLVAVLCGCNLTVENSGGGVVSSSDELINCGEVCMAAYSNTNNELITLIAVPDAGYQFTGWGGQCAELDECVVSMGVASQDRLVTAQFSKTAYGIGGEIIGLEGSLRLSNNGEDFVDLDDSDLTFLFSTSLTEGELYNVEVVESPENQACITKNNTGTVGQSDIAHIIITCELINFPDPNVTISTLASELLSFYAKAPIIDPEKYDTQYVWTLMRGIGYGSSREYRALYTGPSNTFDFAVDVNLNTHPNYEIVCEIQVKEISGTDWVTEDSVIWEFKLFTEQTAPIWKGHAFVRNLNDVAALKGMTSIEGDLIIDDISFDAFDFLSSITEVDGMLSFINNPNLKSLSDLGTGNITRVSRSLVVSGNNSLTSLSGLDNLQSVQQLNINFNKGLESITGLDNLRSIGISLSIRDNENLKTISAWKNLQEFSGHLSIGDNPKLESITGLENVQSLESAFFLRNNALTSLETLRNLESIKGHLWASELTSLTVLGLDNLSSIGDDFNFSSNYQLTQLSGLGNLQTIGGSFSVSHGIFSSFSGLENLREIGGHFRVFNNQNLTSVTELISLQRVSGDFEFLYNRSLCDSSVEPLQIQVQNTEGIGGSIDIDNSGC